MKTPDKKIFVLTEVESTNNYANQLLLSKAADEGTVVLAHYQKSGRGQGLNSWESEPFKNILASFILLPQFLPAAKQFYISKIVSLAITNVLSEICSEKAQIKWPNDIYIGDKKIAGILIENSIKGRIIDWSVVGVGLNVNQKQFASDAPNPVSLAQITAKEYDISGIVDQLFDRIFYWYQILKNQECRKIDEEYFLSLYRISGWHLYRKNGQEFEAKIVGIGEFGQLQLENRNGEKQEFMFKEVEFVIK